MKEWIIEQRFLRDIEEAKREAYLVEQGRVAFHNMRGVLETAHQQVRELTPDQVLHTSSY